MELIKSWEFNKNLLDRNIALILKIYHEFLRERLPSLDEVVEAVENLNRQILSSQLSDGQDIDEKFEECVENGDFACMDMFVANILDKCKNATVVNQEFVLGSAVNENDTSVFIINDCQNVLKEFLDSNESLISQGAEFTQVFKKPDLIPKLEAGV